MNAGLPTTGIGGIFYFISVFVMFFSELYITFRGRSSLRRWRFVMGQVLLVAGIIGASWATAFLLVKTVPSQIKTQITAISNGSSSFEDPEKIFLLPFIILGVLLVITQLLRAYFVLKKKLFLKA